MELYENDFLKKSANLIKKIAGVGKTTFTLTSFMNDIDPRYFKEKYWKLDNFANLTNSWCRIWVKEDERPPNITSSSFYNKEKIKENTVKTVKDRLIPTLDSSIYEYDILIFGVSFDISISPVVIETNVKGFSHPVYQIFSTNAYDITMTFTESGPLFYQQNSKHIAKLLNVLNSGLTLNISNPELEMIYGVDKVVFKNGTFAQNQNFYSQKNVSLTFKSDRNYDIIQKTTDTII